MDENYLDNLLNEFSLDKEIDNKIEDELDDQIEQEKLQHQKETKQSQDDLFNMDLDLDAADMNLDTDFDFSEEQMDELDNLDDLADLDLSNLDFSDVDLNDLDMTNLDSVETGDLDDLLKEFEGNLDVDTSYDLKESEDEPQPVKEPEQDENADVPDEKEETVVLQQEELNEDSFDADNFLDSLLEESDDKPIEDELPEKETQKESEEEPQYNAMDTLDDFSDFGQIEEHQQEFGQPEETEKPETSEGISQSDEADLDDLFSLLDLDEPEQDETSSVQEEELADNLKIIEDLDDIQDIGETSKKAKKKGFMELLFGEDDEEISPEEIAKAEAEKEAKKAEKKAKKQAAKEAKQEKAEAKKAEKDSKDLQKKKEDAEKQRVRAEKKAKQRAIDLEEAKKEKKLNKAAVIFIFTFFLGGVFVLYLASNNFNYTLAIQKATNYFESQKYHKAYDEIKGVDVKEKDQDLKDRIYTVMYVERLYESYENNLELGFYDKAFDSLLRGVDKYYEHYDEAVELGIEDDINYSFEHIQEALRDNFGISVEQAMEINKLDDDQYVLQIRAYVEANQDKLTDSKSKEDANIRKEEEVTQ